MSDAVRVVQRWHEAVDARDIEAVLALCADDVAIGGPRGVGNGHDLVRGWLVRSGIALTPQHDLVEEGGRIVVHEHAHWRTADAPAEVPTEPTDTWVVFEVRDGLVSAIRRYDAEAEVPSP